MTTSCRGVSEMGEGLHQLIDVAEKIRNHQHQSATVDARGNLVKYIGQICFIAGLLSAEFAEQMFQVSRSGAGRM
jgi:hypothetical protein